MRFGMMVTTDRLLGQLVGIARAAVARGHEVVIFATDAGARLVTSPELAALSELPGVAVGYCELSAERQGVRREELPEAIVEGSQFQNSLMVEASDRLIVL